MCLLHSLRRGRCGGGRRRQTIDRRVRYRGRGRSLRWSAAAVLLRLLHHRRDYCTTRSTPTPRQRRRRQHSRHRHQRWSFRNLGRDGSRKRPPPRGQRVGSLRGCRRHRRHTGRTGGCTRRDCLGCCLCFHRYRRPCYLRHRCRCRCHLRRCHFRLWFASDHGRTQRASTTLKRRMRTRPFLRSLFGDSDKLIRN